MLSSSLSELVILISPDKLNYVQGIEFGNISGAAMIQDRPFDYAQFTVAEKSPFLVYRYHEIRLFLEGRASLYWFRGDFLKLVRWGFLVLSIVEIENIELLQIHLLSVLNGS